MDTVDPLRFIFSFVFILGLIGVMALVLKRYARMQSFGQMAADGNSRISVIETRYLDAKRRLVLIRKDKNEHLLLLAEGRELVIESTPQNDMMSPVRTDEP